jgi:predicted membrane protein
MLLFVAMEWLLAVVYNSNCYDMTSEEVNIVCDHDVMWNVCAMMIIFQQKLV